MTARIPMPFTRYAVSPESIRVLEALERELAAMRDQTRRRWGLEPPAPSAGAGLPAPAPLRRLDRQCTSFL